MKTLLVILIMAWPALVLAGGGESVKVIGKVRGRTPAVSSKTRRANRPATSSISVRTAKPAPEAEPTPRLTFAQMIEKRGKVKVDWDSPVMRRAARDAQAETRWLAKQAERRRLERQAEAAAWYYSTSDYGYGYGYGYDGGYLNNNNVSDDLYMTDIRSRILHGVLNQTGVIRTSRAGDRPGEPTYAQKQTLSTYANIYRR